MYEWKFEFMNEYTNKQKRLRHFPTAGFYHNANRCSLLESYINFVSVYLQKSYIVSVMISSNLISSRERLN